MIKKAFAECLWRNFWGTVGWGSRSKNDPHTLVASVGLSQGNYYVWHKLSF